MALRRVDLKFIQVKDGFDVHCAREKASIGFADGLFRLNLRYFKITFITLNPREANSHFALTIALFQLYQYFAYT